MERLKVISRYGYCTKLNKVPLFHDVIENKETLKFLNYTKTPKDYMDLYFYDLILRGIGLHQKVLVKYNQFILDNPELSNHLSYEQKNKIFKVDIEDIIRNQCVEIEKQLIFLPYLNKEFNKMFLEDFESTMRKPYVDEINRVKDPILEAKQVYGIALLKTHLSKVSLVFDDGTYSYFYDQSIGMVYKVEGIDLVCVYGLFHKSLAVYPDSVIIKELLMIEEYSDFVDRFYNLGLCSDKVYKKICKKLKVK